MTEINKTRPAPLLHSELARYCLPATGREANRKLAWTNSICLMFLIVGLAGAKKAPVTIRAVKPLEEAVSAIIEPLPPPPSTTQEQPQQEQTDQDKSEAPQVVVVTMDTPAINFSVPTIGNLVVPNALAKAPPLHSGVAAVPARKQPSLLQSTGQSGDRPQPAYPKFALETGQQGSVVLSMTVDEAGLITAIEVKESSGSPLLDHSALDFVKKHWTVLPGVSGRIFLATITYKIQ